MFRLALALLTGVFLFLPKLGIDAQRGVLWRVVQACVANHALTGASFPCLSVETANGPAAGYVAIVSPTVQTIGIAAQRLRGPDAPNYFQDAWASRSYATDGLARQPGRADLALAVNSRIGRSQDQLHIHIDCIRPKVRDVLARDASRVAVGRWTHLRVMPASPQAIS